jgi:hypothetical protein
MKNPVKNDTVKAALLFAAGVIAIVVAVAKDWLSGDELSFVVLAALSGGVFVGAYSVANRQIAAETKTKLLQARDEIVALKKKNAELQTALEQARKQAKAAKAFDAQNAAALAVASAQQQSLDLDSALSSISDVVDKLPENQRLAGVWVATALTLAVLGFFVAADVTVSTSDTTSTATTTSTTPTSTTTTP